MTAINEVIDNKDFLTTEQAAAIALVKPGTLVNWRCTGKENIPFFKIGRKVFYKRQDILNWRDQQRVERVA